MKHANPLKFIALLALALLAMAVTIAGAHAANFNAFGNNITNVSQIDLTDPPVDCSNAGTNYFMTRFLGLTTTCTLINESAFTSALIPSSSPVSGRGLYATGTNTVAPNNIVQSGTATIVSAYGDVTGTGDAIFNVVNNTAGTAGLCVSRTLGGNRICFAAPQGATAYGAILGLTTTAQQIYVASGTINGASLVAGDVEFPRQVMLDSKLFFSNAATGTIYIRNQSNACAGRATLSGGSAAVSTTCFTSNSTDSVFLSNQNTGGTAGFLKVTSRVQGSGFTITSSSGTDTSEVAWWIQKLY